MILLRVWILFLEIMLAFGFFLIFLFASFHGGCKKLEYVYSPVCSSLVANCGEIARRIYIYIYILAISPQLACIYVLAVFAADWWHICEESFGAICTK